jgi:hypothetical protein
MPNSLKGELNAGQNAGDAAGWALLDDLQNVVSVHDWGWTFITPEFWKLTGFWRESSRPLIVAVVFTLIAPWARMSPYQGPLVELNVTEPETT